MGIVEQYLRGKMKFSSDRSICAKNRKLFQEFFMEEEYKLKRVNGLQELDEPCYRTLVTYFRRLKLLNACFGNKPWTELTHEDIKRVFDGLEDGTIRPKNGQRYRDRQCFYQIMRGRLFEMAGKDKLAKEVLKYCRGRDRIDVRFIREETVRKIVDIAVRPEHKLLIWLAFDVGENVGTLLRLQVKDMVRQENPDSHEAEYIVNLPQSKLKRSRTTRSEITNFKETVQLLDILLNGKTADDFIFNFRIRQAHRFLIRAVNIVNARCLPAGQRVTWKDLRSSMACHLLSKGWSTDEIKARLGHTPSSRVLDKYLSYLAINRHGPKKKLIDSDVNTLRSRFEESQATTKLLSQRISRLQEEMVAQRDYFVDILEKLEPVNKRIKERHKGPRPDIATDFIDDVTL